MEILYFGGIWVKVRICFSKKIFNRRSINLCHCLIDKSKSSLPVFGKKKARRKIDDLAQKRALFPDLFSSFAYLSFELFIEDLKVRLLACNTRHFLKALADRENEKRVFKNDPSGVFKGSP